MTENTENGASSHERSECIQCRDDFHVSVDVVIEFVERSIHDDVTEANGQREEHLCDRRKPNVWTEQSFPSWIDEIPDSIPSSFQCDGAHQQNTHDDVWEQCKEI